MQIVKTFKFYKISEFSEAIGSAHGGWGKFMEFSLRFYTFCHFAGFFTVNASQRTVNVQSTAESTAQSTPLSHVNIATRCSWGTRNHIKMNICSTSLRT